MAGLDFRSPVGVYVNSVYSYTDKIPLDDANEFYSKDYFLLNIRAGFRKQLSKRFGFDVFASVDNAFDEKYSLGNDLNARGMRFFNAAPGRNYSVGMKFEIR